MCVKSARRHHASAEEQMTYPICGYAVNQTGRAIADLSIADLYPTRGLCEQASPWG
jgi:hypothetical protein